MSSSRASGPHSGLGKRPIKQPTRKTVSTLDRTRDRKRAAEKKTAGKKTARRQRNKPSSRLEASRRSAFIAESHQASRQRTPALRRKASRKTVPGKASGKAAVKTSPRAPSPVRLLVRWLFGGRHQNPRKALVAGGSVATLALLAVVPARVGSQAIAFSNCQEVVKSGAEISRGQITSLLSIPEGSRRAAVRQVVDEPYCLLPAMTVDNKAVDDKGAENKESKNTEKTLSEGPLVTEREAYPLAFDPEAWVVVRYVDDEYAGYDFVFKP